MKKCLLLVLGLGLWAGFSTSARADVVTTRDGRIIEGQIANEDAQAVRIDTMINGQRVMLTVKKEAVEKLEKKALPEGYFGVNVPDNRISDPAKFSATDNLYLEIPITGAFGDKVYASGVEKTLAYAERVGIKHIVFVIDSEGWNLDEAGAMYRVLQAHAKRLSFHAIVNKCLGAALSVALWCETIHMTPNSVIGGADIPKTLRDNDIDAGQLTLERAQVAEEVGKRVSTTDGPDVAALVRAMIDPTESLYGWLDADGVLHLTAAKPQDPKTEMVFESPSGKILQLTRDQGVKLGMKTISGPVSSLGTLLELCDWKPESDYGIKAMKAAEVEAKRKASIQALAYQDKITKNLRRREEAKTAIESSIKGAAEWDPDKGSYATYQRRWGWGGWGGWGRSYGGGSSNTFTQESQKQWTIRTDNTMTYLKRAAANLVQAKKLDKEAVDLGIEPTWKSGELDNMAADMEAKYQILVKNRTKTGK